MRLLVSLLAWILRAVFRSRRSLVLENLALRQQLAAFARAQKRPRLKPDDKAFWMALSKVWRDWRSSLVLVSPATVIAWHRRGYHRYWTWKCGRPGRPRFPADHIAFIRRISTDHPEWGEDRIAGVPGACGVLQSRAAVSGVAWDTRAVPCAGHTATNERRTDRAARARRNTARLPAGGADGQLNTTSPAMPAEWTTPRQVRTRPIHSDQSAAGAIGVAWQARSPPLG
jgi:hypothetical protein